LIESGDDKEKSLMHMANELLSVPVAVGTMTLAAGGLGFVCRKVKAGITTERRAVMGIMGAFVFAAQMINIQLPAMPGTSAHMIGAVLLAILLGPHAGALVMSSVIIVQCLIFQDGGLLALGCNLLNMALLPSYLGFAVYRMIAQNSASPRRLALGTMAATFVTVEMVAILIPVQAQLSGVLAVPFPVFLMTMLAVHLLVGLMEGLLTIAVLQYLRQLRPGLSVMPLPGRQRFSLKATLGTLALLAVLIAGGLSLVASDLPDGLEWAYAHRPDQPEFQAMTGKAHQSAESVDDLQAKLAPIPNYTRRGKPLGQKNTEPLVAASAWTSFAGVTGSLLTMGLVWFVSIIIRKKKQSPALKTC
jgi:cobalt/nickel transport system permease protein